MAIINKSRPNTGVDDIFLSANIILCCGEDWQELLTALGSFTAEKPILHHEYRCYRISKFTDFSLIWSGMGTGCLEPLLYELREASIIRKIVLIGTAGAISIDKIKLGDLYIAEEAFLGGTAVNLHPNTASLKPDFPKDLLDQTNLACARIASTDYYYGFSKNPASENLRLADLVLKKAVTELFDGVDLVDMETAQFYYFCQTLFPPDSLSYISIKGATNSIADQSLQIAYTPEVLQKALRASFVLLRLGAQETPATIPPAAVTLNEATSVSKLMEEVKLFWTIQIAVCAVLGYLGTNLTLSAPQGASNETLSSLYLKNLSISFVSFFLIQIGSIYNLVGNYYARVAASGLRFEAQQEDRITPTLAVFYLIISGFIAAVGVRTGIFGLLKPVAPWPWLIGAACIGIWANCFVCGFVIYRSLVRRTKGYGRYAKSVRTVYISVAILTLLVGAMLYWFLDKTDIGAQKSLREIPELVGIPF